MKAIYTVAIMLTVAPMLVVVTMGRIDPEHFGTSNPFYILIMTFFAVITVPVWPTYIPAIVLAPIVMRRVAGLKRFHTLPLPLVVALSLYFGAIAGLCIIVPVVLMAPPTIGPCWGAAGATSGALKPRFFTDAMEQMDQFGKRMGVSAALKNPKQTLIKLKISGDTASGKSSVSFAGQHMELPAQFKKVGGGWLVDASISPDALAAPPAAATSNVATANVVPPTVTTPPAAVETTPTAPSSEKAAGEPAQPGNGGLVEIAPGPSATGPSANGKTAIADLKKSLTPGSQWSNTVEIPATKGRAFEFQFTSQGAFKVIVSDQKGISPEQIKKGRHHTLYAAKSDGAERRKKLVLDAGPVDIYVENTSHKTVELHIKVSPSEE